MVQSLHAGLTVRVLWIGCKSVAVINPCALISKFSQFLREVPPNLPALTSFTASGSSMIASYRIELIFGSHLILVCFPTLRPRYFLVLSCSIVKGICIRAFLCSSNNFCISSGTYRVFFQKPGASIIPLIFILSPRSSRTNCDIASYDLRLSVILYQQYDGYILYLNTFRN